MPAANSVVTPAAVNGNDERLRGWIGQLRDFGETRRGWLGVRIQDITDDLAEGLGLETASGALVTDVPEGPALEAGIEAGDVIMSFDGVDVEDTRGLVRQVADTEVGKEVRVIVFRNGQTETLRVTLGRREEAEGAVPASVVLTHKAGDFYRLAPSESFPPLEPGQSLALPAPWRGSTRR